MLTEIPLHINSVRSVAEINLILKEHKAHQLASRSSSISSPGGPAVTFMDTIEAAGQQAAIEDGVLQTVDSSGAEQTQALRRGKWTQEEEEYSTRLILEFKNGTLPLTDGTTLRTFLSKLLNCDPMRISKKFVGNNSIGKQIFRRNFFDGADQDQVDLRMEQTKRELAELERRFLEKVAETNMKMCTKYEDIQEFGSTDGSPGKPGGEGGALPTVPRDSVEQRPWMLPPGAASMGSVVGAAGLPRVHSNSGSTEESQSPKAAKAQAAAANGFAEKGGQSGLKREMNGLAPAVTMPFTLAKMHAAAELNGALDKNKKRARQRRRSNSSVSAASDTSSGGNKKSPRRGGIQQEFQVPMHPMYSSFGGEWVGGRGPYSDQKTPHTGQQMTTPQYDHPAGGSGLKRVTSLDLLCSGTMGHSDLNEWSFGNGMQDWSNLVNSNGKGGTDSQKKRQRTRGASFDGSDDGLRYDDGQGMGHSDSTADLMSLLGQVSSSNRNSSSANIGEEYGHEGVTPFTSSALHVFSGNRARTVSGQSYDGSDFGLSYSPRASYPENEFHKDQIRGMQVSGSAVFHNDDSLPMETFPHGVDISPVGLQHTTSGVRSEAGSGADFMWSADFSEEHADGNRRRTASGDRLRGRVTNL